jgi:hypothetical protein
VDHEASSVQGREKMPKDYSAAQLKQNISGQQTDINIKVANDSETVTVLNNDTQMLLQQKQHAF